MARLAGALLALVAATACSAAGPATSADRTAVRRDVEGYAIATCLGLRGDPALKAEGDSWGAIIVERGRGNVEDWEPLIAAVKADSTASLMYLVKGDGPVGSERAAPVAYCAEIVDRPRVRAAIKATIAKMAPAYRDK